MDQEKSARLPTTKQEALEQLIQEAPSDERLVLCTALRMFHAEVRHVAMGIFPDHLANRVGTITQGRHHPSVSEAEAALKKLTALGVVERSLTGLYVSTEGLLQYLEATSFYIEGEIDATTGEFTVRQQTAPVHVP